MVPSSGDEDTDSIQRNSGSTSESLEEYRKEQDEEYALSLQAD